jgi:hypothetical protein
MTSSTLRTVRPAPNALQENTPAILRLYTQDLKSFVSQKEKDLTAGDAVTMEDLHHPRVAKQLAKPRKMQDARWPFMQIARN